MGRAARTRLAGCLAVIAALVATELVHLPIATKRSLMQSVQFWFISTFAGSLKDLAVSLFGNNDKIALIVGAWLVALSFGPLAARLEVSCRGRGLAVFAAFGLLGVLTSIGQPNASVPNALLAAVIGTAVGVSTLTVLLDRFSLRAAPRLRRILEGTGPRPEGGDFPPSSLKATRRDVMLWTVGTAATLGAVGAITKFTGDSLRQARSVIPKVLPKPVKSASIPELQPFTASGLSSYITPNRDFYRIDISPDALYVDTASWRLRINGLVDRPLELSYEELLARPLVEEIVTLSCVSNEVGGDLVGNARWLGVPLRELLSEAGVRAGAEQIMSSADDGFSGGFPLSLLDDPQRPALLALGMNGEPLPRLHGFPARLVIAGIYGYISATKWVNEIRLTTMDEEGFWIPRGWSKLGPIKTQSRIDTPRNQASLVAGKVPVAGVAWAPNRGISKVEVRVNEGPWRAADLGKVASDDTWVQWLYPWDAQAGDHRLEVRAIDGDGQVQPETSAPPAPDGAQGWHSHSVKVAAN